MDNPFASMGEEGQRFFEIISPFFNFIHLPISAPEGFRKINLCHQGFYTLKGGGFGPTEREFTLEEVLELGGISFDELKQMIIREVLKAQDSACEMSYSLLRQQEFGFQKVLETLISYKSSHIKTLVQRRQVYAIFKGIS